MKKCQRCGQDNSDSMSYCVECGTALPSVMGAPSIDADSAPTVFAGGQETKTVVSNQIPRPAGFYQPAKKSNVGKFLLIGGGIVALLGLGVVGIAAVAIYNMMPGNGVTLKPTPQPTRGIDISPPYPDGPPPTPAATPQASFTPPVEPTKKGSFTVYANKGWQLSDLDTVPLEQFTTTINGKVDVSGVKNGMGPEGVNTAVTKSRRIYPNFPTGALLMRTRYADGNYSNIVALTAAGPVGQWQNYPNERGKIEFCVNDKEPENNGGSFVVTKAFVAVPKGKK